MAHAEESITINRPANAVFDFVISSATSPWCQSASTPQFG